MRRSRALRRRRRAGPALTGSRRRARRSARTGADRAVVGHNPSNAVYGEVLGNGLVYSLNYERLFAPRGSDRGAWAFAAERATSPTRSRTRPAAAILQLASFPLVVSWYVGTPHHKLQLGLGATLLYVSASTDASGTKYAGTSEGLGVAATAVVGYRYMPAHTGFTFGVAFTPLLRTTKGFLPWGGASAGIAF